MLQTIPKTEKNVSEAQNNIQNITMKQENLDENQVSEAQNNIQNITMKQENLDENQNLQSAAQNDVKPVITEPRRSNRLRTPKLKEPEQLQHCAIRKESPRESGVSRKVNGSAKKPISLKPLSKIIPTKASFNEEKEPNIPRKSKPILTPNQELPQQVYPRKLGKPAISKSAESKPSVSHDNVLSSAPSSEPPLKMKEEPLVKAAGFPKKKIVAVLHPPDLISESFKKQVEKVTSKQCGIVAMREEEEEYEPPLEDDEFMEVVEDPISEVRHEQISIPDADEMWQGSDNVSIENKKEGDEQQVKSEEIPQKEETPPVEIKEKTIQEIIDDACRPYDREPPKKYDYRRMFLPTAYTATHDEFSIMKLFGRCDSQNTVVHYDSKGTMLGNGVVTVHRSKEDFAVQHSKNTVYAAKRLIRLPLENPENSELYDMYIYNIPKVDDVATIMKSLKQEYQATDIQLFFNPHGFFIGSCRASMTYENAKKLTGNRTYTMKNKTYTVSAYRIDY